MSPSYSQRSRRVDKKPRSPSRSRRRGVERSIEATHAKAPKRRRLNWSHRKTSRKKPNNSESCRSAPKINSNEFYKDSKQTPNEKPRRQDEDEICVVCRDSWRNLFSLKVKKMRLTCGHDLCSKCLNRLKTNPTPGSVPRFLNAVNLEPVYGLGFIPAEAYEALNRPEFQFQFGDDEELERYDRE